MTEPVTLLLPDELYKKIEKRRGLVKRSTFIVDLLSRALSDDAAGKKKPKEK